MSRRPTTRSVTTNRLLAALLSSPPVSMWLREHLDPATLQLLREAFAEWKDGRGCAATPDRRVLVSGTPALFEWALPRLAGAQAPDGQAAVYTHVFALRDAILLPVEPNERLVWYLWNRHLRDANLACVSVHVLTAWMYAARATRQLLRIRLTGDWCERVRRQQVLQPHSADTLARIDYSVAYWEYRDLLRRQRLDAVE